MGIIKDFKYFKYKDRFTNHLTIFYSFINKIQCIEQFLIKILILFRILSKITIYIIKTNLNHGFGMQINVFILSILFYSEM